MIGGVTRHMLPHLSRVPHLQVNRLLVGCHVNVQPLPQTRWAGHFKRSLARLRVVPIFPQGQ